MKNRGKPSKDAVISPKHHTGVQNGCEDKLCEGDSKKNIVKVPELNQSRKICGVNVISVLKVLIVVTLVPPFLNYASLQKESRSLRPPGELKTTPKGHKLFVNCSGKGLPVVMMDAPGGSSSDIWSLVQPQVAKFTKVCVYDRTGLGFSESLAGHAQDKLQNESNGDDVVRKRLHPTAENMVDDLHSMLKDVSNGSDVILVGGGLGAINARFYTRMYDGIFGLVLINSFYESMFTQGMNEWTTFWYEKLIPSLQLQQILASFGLIRLGLLTGFIKPEKLADSRLNQDMKARQKYLLCNSGHITSGISEHYYVNESLTQLKIVRKLKRFPGGVPVIIISSKNFSRHVPTSLNDFWHMNQQLLVDEVYPHSERIFVDRDFNSVYFDDATSIVKAIRKLVKKFRKSVKQAANI